MARTPRPKAPAMPSPAALAPDKTAATKAVTQKSATLKATVGKSKSPTKLFVLDTNVLMHDPTSLYRFQEHDLYLPMAVLGVPGEPPPLFRMPIADISTKGEGKESRCLIRLSPEVIRTAPLGHRPFQGWRYLEAKDAPQDLSRAEATDLPDDLVKQLRSLGAW